MKKVIIPIILMVSLVLTAWMSYFSKVSSHQAKVDTLVSEAEHNLDLKVYYKAMDQYYNLIELDDGNIDHYHKFMDLAYITNELDAYESITLKTIDKFPTDPKAYKDIINYYMLNNEFVEVQNIALKANEHLEDSSEFRELYFEASYQYSEIGGRYDSVNDFIGFNACVIEDGKWGMINQFGDFILEPIYKHISAFSGGMAAVSLEDETYFVNKSGHPQLRTKEKVDLAMPFISGLSVIKQGDKYGYADKDYNLYEVEWDFATSYLYGVAAVKKDDKWAIRDFNREYVTEFIFDDVIYDDNYISSNNGVIIASVDNIYYLFNINGEKIIENGFEDAKPFSEEGIAPIKVDGKWGFINTSGDLIIDFIYEDAYAFGIGIAPVKLDDKWFYVDANNDVMLEGDFEEARTFSKSGLAAVKVNKDWTYIQLEIYK